MPAANRAPEPIRQARPPWGSKAYGLLRLAQLGLPVPPAFVARHRRLPRILRPRRPSPRCGARLARAGIVASRTGHRPRFRQRTPAIAGVGPLRRPPSRCRDAADPAQHRSVREQSPRLAASPPGIRARCGIATGGWCATSPRWCTARMPRSSTPSSPATARSRRLAGRGRYSIARRSAQIAEESLELTLALAGEPFPQDPLRQLVGAVEAGVPLLERRQGAPVSASQRNRTTRMGTAVTVRKRWCFGNSGGSFGRRSGVHARSGVRGETAPYLDFLFNAQGEDVVSGRHAGQEDRQPAAAASAGGGRTGPHADRPGERVPRHAGFRVHGRDRPPVSAADPLRQAHSLGRRCASPSTW